jgi:hypothetical protein
MEHLEGLKRKDCYLEELAVARILRLPQNRIKRVRVNLYRRRDQERRLAFHAMMNR